MRKITIKTILFTLDFIFIIFILALINFLIIDSAYAYVDPSVMTYTIQALAGVAVALSAVVGVIWRRLRKRALGVFGIDENAGKLIEPNVQRINPANKKSIDKNAQTTGFAAEVTEKNSNTVSLDIKWPKRFFIGFLSALFVTFTVVFVAPCELVAGNKSSLVFGLTQVWPIMVVATILISLIAAIFLSLFKKKFFYYALIIIVAIGICFYIQSLFLNHSLPIANGGLLDWDNYTKITLLSTAVWIFVIGGLLLFCMKFKKMTFSIIPLICAALIIIQAAGVASLFIEKSDAIVFKTTPTAQIDPQVQNAFVTNKGLFNISSKSNVIVFILDAMDNADILPLLKDNPEYFDEFEGFTAFSDVVGGMTPTCFAMPYLISGELPYDDESASSYLNERYDRSSFLSDINNNGYTIGLYTYGYNNLLYNKQKIVDLAMNVRPDSDNTLSKAIDRIGTFSVLVKCSLYRDMPWLLKPFFWYSTDEINTNMLDENINPDAYDSSPYISGDVAYYNSLIARGLTPSDDGSEGAFKLIHLVGAHNPYIMDENAQNNINATREQQVLGSIKIVSEYIRQLKQLNLYDNTTFIITSDHGLYYVDPETVLSQTIEPILLIKSANSTNLPIVISDVPVSHANYFATVIDAVGGESEEYGETFFNISDPDKPRYYYTTNIENGRDSQWLKYVITGYAGDFNNWEYTGIKWELFE